MVITPTFVESSNVSGSLSDIVLKFIVWQSHQSWCVPESTKDSSQQQRVITMPNSVLTNVEI
jgi:hypothetical protein